MQLPSTIQFNCNWLAVTMPYNSDTCPPVYTTVPKLSVSYGFMVNKVAAVNYVCLTTILV